MGDFIARMFEEYSSVSMAAAVEDNVQDVEENVEEHVVSAIRAAKFVDGVLMFAVEWEGFDVGMGT